MKIRNSEVNLHVLVLSFHLVGLETWTRVISVALKSSYAPSHLVSPRSVFLITEYWRLLHLVWLLDSVPYSDSLSHRLGLLLLRNTKELYSLEALQAPNFKFWFICMCYEVNCYQLALHQQTRDLWPAFPVLLNETKRKLIKPSTFYPVCLLGVDGIEH